MVSTIDKQGQTVVQSSQTAQNSSSKGTINSKSIMGKDDFLKLMITQLKYQDPLSPLDGSEFAAQLAQFSSLEQLHNLNESVKQSVDANYLLIQSVNNTMTANLIGKETKISLSTINYHGQDSITFGYTLPGNAKDVTIKIYDENNNLVKTINPKDLSKGDHKLSWDFTDNNGEKVKNGNYRIEISAKGLNGEDMKASGFLIGVISGIKFTQNGTKLIIDGSEYDVSDVLEIIQPQQQGEEDDGNG